MTVLNTSNYLLKMGKHGDVSTIKCDRARKKRSGRLSISEQLSQITKQLYVKVKPKQAQNMSEIIPHYIEDLNQEVCKMDVDSRQLR